MDYFQFDCVTFINKTAFCITEFKYNKLGVVFVTSLKVKTRHGGSKLTP